MVTADDLARISGNPDPAYYDLAGDAAALAPEMERAGVTKTRERMAKFLGNVCQETDRLKTLEEYGDEAYFRSFLGSQWRYHGRGYIMNTWLDAYRRLSAVLGKDLVSDPGLLARDKELAARAALWFWTENGLNGWSDRGSLWNVSGIINTGGPNPARINGWPERLAFYNRALDVLADREPPAPKTPQPPEAPAEVTRYRTALEYIKPAIGRARYVWWTSGPVPSGSPAWATNRPAPPIEDVARHGVFCAGVTNLMLRRVGKRIPIINDENYDGGTLAYREYFRGYDEPFDLAKAKRWAREAPDGGVLVGRPYRSPSDQGHVAVVLRSGYVLQSYDAGGGRPGLNWDHTIEASHNGWYYTYMVHPKNWINYKGDEF